jgi:Spy/CpxP family protein refolding chaperone
MRKTLAVGAALAFVTSLAAAQGGPGMMPGYGGPGMMGGYGMGAGPGMTGGYGMGYGPGMMGGYGLASLNLSEEQQSKVFAIQEDRRKKNFDTMSKMRSETFQLRRMYGAENIDSKAVLEQQKKVDELRRAMLASRLEMRKQVEGVLTPEQRKQLRQVGPWWMSEEAD